MCEAGSTTDHYLSSGRETSNVIHTSPYHERSPRQRTDIRSKSARRKEHVDKNRSRDSSVTLNLVNENSEQSGSDRSERIRHGRAPTVRTRSLERFNNQSIKLPKKHSNPEQYSEAVYVNRVEHNQNRLVPFVQYGSSNSELAQNTDRESRYSHESRESRYSRDSRDSRYSRDSRESRFSRESQRSSDSRVSREHRFSKDSSPAPVDRRSSRVISSDKCNSPTLNTLQASSQKLLESQVDNISVSSRSSPNHQYSGGYLHQRNIPSISSVPANIHIYKPLHDIENVYKTHKRRQDSRKLRPDRISSTNSLSPDMALLRDHRKQR